jgi:hypothetical protein
MSALNAYLYKDLFWPNALRKAQVNVIYNTYVNM